MISKLKDYIRSKDDLVQDSSNLLHFDGEKNIKTLFGGIFTILVQIFVLQVAVSRSIQMFTYDQPYFHSTENSYETFPEYKTAKQKWVDMVKPLLIIWEGGDDNPTRSVKLDRESRKYIHVRLDNRET
jgi:hypothetical protein